MSNGGRRGAGGVCCEADLIQLRETWSVQTEDENIWVHVSTFAIIAS